MLRIVLPGLATLDAAGLKTRTTRSALTAADTTVIYVSAADVSAVVSWLRPFAGGLCGPVPACTDAVADGVALAPGHGAESYGARVCARLAAMWVDGITDHHALDRGLTESIPRLAPSVVRDARRAWRAPGPAANDHPHRVPSPPRSVSSSLKDTLAAVVADLTGTAIWRDGACSWLVRTHPDQDRHGLAGPYLYDGTAGIAVALTHAARALGCEQTIETAAGAATHAARTVGTDPTGYDLGLFTGGAGAWHAVRIVAAHCGRPDLHRQASERLAGLTVPRGRGPWDLIDGLAGYAYQASLLDPPARPAAESLGRVARRLDSLRSRQLGLAHGVLGRDLALAALAPGGTGATAGPASVDPVVLRRRGGTSWCRGTAGLVEADRLVRLLRGDGYREGRVDEALRTLLERHAAVAERTVPTGNLCHGPLGAVLILLLRDHEISPPPSLTTDWYGHEYRSAEPGLMTGKAGVAHTLAVALATMDSLTRPTTLLALLVSGSCRA
ncbi:lanthionine synthetase LanC family protein [Jiangella endophytica]|uniref:lanthionine synthetase LanC family protein n=1 Tax=Jiangella endophytica TaxID=1623398 RepID=UPI000E34A8C3|nr:lanthionine synthetase LanC family protein [Jiangella endophytica]